MKWKTEKRESKPRPQTFLVLPLVDNNREGMTKSPSLRLQLTNAWQSKDDLDNDIINESNIIVQRPLTATLERPEILDIRFIDKLDMSNIRKEFLSITNLCNDNLNSTQMSTITITNNTKRDVTRTKQKPIINKRPVCSSRLSQLATPRQVHQQQISNNTSDDSWEDDSSTSLPQSARKSVIRSRIIAPKRLPKKHNKFVAEANNELNNNGASNKTIKETTIGMIRKNKIPSIDKAMKSIKALPEPCTTCGRPDQPERFHSHPIAPIKASAQRHHEVTKVPVKISVQKPTAIRYKSKLTQQQPTSDQANTNKANNNPNSGRDAPHGERKMSLPAQQLLHTPPGHNQGPAGDARVRSSRGPRTLTCYLCGREFGTASLPLHEPKCLERLQRENATLPAHLRRNLPLKPKSPLSQQEWNRFAWEASQQLLTPCHCGRTFHPDRLVVHQRSCKVNAPNVPVKSPGIESIKYMPPPSVQCKICGKLFGTKSIKYHEPQCIKKWQNEHGTAPPPERLAASTQNNTPSTRVPPPLSPAGPASSSSHDTASTEGRPTSGKKPPMFPCYLCGRLFSVNSIYIHEPQCLKKWRIENDKLPAAKRRTEPLKPDIKFTQDGKIDIEATNEVNWRSHLSQLVPCKLCNRTFNPDRVDIHERNSSGNVDYMGTFNRVWENHLAELRPCRRCGRTFFADRIEKHEQNCNAELRREQK